MAEGYVHSMEVGSFVDGPGVRFVVFLAGCPLRCRYCHNPDAWKATAGERMDSAQVLERIAHSAAFLKAGDGGVTVSGGEPLVQADFALAILRGSHELGLHTALDTSGYLGERVTDEMLGVLDLVLLDIKSWDRETYRLLTGVDLAPTLRLAERLCEAGTPGWVRFVLVPGVTGVSAIAAGYGFTIVKKYDSTLWSWGDNSHGQLGDGHLEQNPQPGQIAGLDSPRPIGTVALPADQARCCLRQ
jgi:pyruvate formate lyase activating enzyme